MSEGWDVYIERLISLSNDACDKACIIGLDGNMWTSPYHPKSLKLTQVEIANLSKAMKNKDSTCFEIDAVYAEGCRYQYLRRDENVVLAKQKDNGGITIQSSKTACIVIPPYSLCFGNTSRYKPPQLKGA